MTDNYGKGFAKDDISGETIGQVVPFQLGDDNSFAPVGANNPMFSIDFIDAVAQGRVSGWRMERKFALATGVGTTQQPLWSSTDAFKFLSAAERVRYSSSSANDAIGGTGAQKILHRGILADGTFSSETVELVSAGDAFTVGEYLHTYRALITQAGVPAATTIVGIADAKGAAGTISGNAETDGSLQCIILPGKNVTTQLIVKTPTLETWFPIRTFASVSSGKSVDLTVFNRAPGTDVFALDSESDFFENNITARTYREGLPGGSEFIVLVKASASGTDVSAVAEFLVREDVA